MTETGTGDNEGAGPGEIVDIVDNGETAAPDIMSIPTEWTQINIVNRKLPSSMQMINFTPYYIGLTAA